MVSTECEIQEHHPFLSPFRTPDSEIQTLALCIAFEYLLDVFFKPVKERYRHDILYGEFTPGVEVKTFRCEPFAEASEKNDLTTDPTWCKALEFFRASRRTHLTMIFFSSSSIGIEDTSNSKSQISNSQ
jgi:hypothetical protein